MNNFIILYQSGEEKNELSLNSWKLYAEKINVKLIYLSDIINKNLNRDNQFFYIFSALNENGINYDNLCIVSDNTLINNSTQNVFNLTDGKLTFAEWDSDFGYLWTNIELYNDLFFKKQNIDPFRFFDFSFFIVQKQHEIIFEKIKKFMEKNYENLKNKLDTSFIPQNFFFDCEYNKLPYVYNMIDMNRKEIVIDKNLNKMGYILNFKNNKNDMEKAYELIFNDTKK